jgi:hypothetical protein
MSAVSVTRQDQRTDVTQEGARKILGRTLEYTTEDLRLAPSDEGTYRSNNSSESP